MPVHPYGHIFKKRELSEEADGMGNTDFRMNLKGRRIGKTV